MGTRETGKLSRSAAAAAMTACLAFTLTACGGEEEKAPRAGSSQPAGQEGEQNGEDPPGEGPGEDKVIATIEGADGVNVVVTSAVRERGGFLTVRGRIENTSGQAYTFDGWTREDQEFAGKGASVAGMTLVDQKGKKRYYLLRDTENNCLCTMFPGGIGAGKTADFFAQFPAPPEDTTEVDLQVPTMSSATVQITDK